MHPVRSQQYHLSKYRAAVPTKRIFDLSANVDVRRRTELKDGSMLCLTTSSQLWPPDNKHDMLNNMSSGNGSFSQHNFLPCLRSEDEGRLLLGWEQLHVLGYPTWGHGARAAGVESCLVHGSWFKQDSMFFRVLVSFLKQNFRQGQGEPGLPLRILPEIHERKWNELGLRRLRIADGRVFCGRQIGS